MATSPYNSSITNVKSNAVASGSDWFNTSPDVANLRMIESIANSLDSAIPSDLKGFDKLSAVLQKTSLTTLNTKFSKLFHGDGNSNSKKPEYLKYGILFLLKLLSEIELCGLMNPLAGQNGTFFDPNPNPPSKDPKWKVQKIAYDTKVSIDFFNSIYNSSRDINTLRSEVEILLSTLLNNSIKISSTDNLGSPDIKKAYPVSTIVKNTVDEFINFIQKNSNIQSASKTDIDKILKKVNDVRTGCDIILSLQNPASFSNFSDKFINSTMSDSVKQLDKILKPNDNIMNVLQGMLGVLVVIDQAFSIVASTLQIFQIILLILKVLVKVLLVILVFLGVLPIPNLYTTTGITNTSAGGQAKLSDKLNSFVKSLGKASNVLKRITIYLQAYISMLDTVISKLEIIIEQLESCNRDTQNVDNAQNIILNRTKEALESLTAKNKTFTDFIQNYQNKSNVTSTNYNGYIIKILTEEINDVELQKYRIPRRYGVGLDMSNIVVVETDPTYASDDNIIIEEVKLLLDALGAKSTKNNPLSNSDLAMILDATNFLFDDPISFDDVDYDTSTDIDSPDNENENSGLGLNAFINKLKGGKKLKKRVRAAMASKKDKLQKDLNTAKQK